MNTIEIDATNCLSELNDHGNVLWWATIEPGLNNDFEETSQETVSKVAKLLAAAPMLYEALESFVRIFEGATMDKRDMLMYSAYNAAKAALAAAK